MRVAHWSGFLAFALSLTSQAALAQGSGDALVIQGGEQGPPVFLAYSPDGGELARVSMFGHVLLDTKSWEKGRAFDIGIRMLAYSPDGKAIVTAEGTDGARLWKAASPGKAGKVRLGKVTEVSVLSHPERTLITKSEAGKGRRVFATGFSADGARFFATDAGGHVQIWVSETGKPEADIAESKAEVRGAAFHPGGELIAFGDVEGVLRVWDLEHRKLTQTITTPSPIVSLCWDGDGKRLVTTHTNRSAMIWDTGSWNAQVEFATTAAAFAPDGKTLALGGVHEVRLLGSKGATTCTIALKKGPVSALAWRPDGRALAVGCLDGSVHIVPIH